MNSLITNARVARESRDAATRALIVAGTPREARYWHQVLQATPRPNSHTETKVPADEKGPFVLAEQGRKGNLLGTLQAYARTFLQHNVGVSPLGSEGSLRHVDQLVMFIGSGTRLSPFTQSLGNMKSAFPLPDATDPRRVLTVGEGAVRSSAVYVDALRRAGFDGLVVRWGDEILIPSTDLSTSLGQYADLDVVRFGGRAEPTELLANEKEWLVVDNSTGLMINELSRQPLHSVRQKISAYGGSADTTTYVNLGSFAASHVFLRSLADSFGDLLFDSNSSANWDPYFWMALHAQNRDEWARLGDEESHDSRTGFADLHATVPHFFDLVQEAKMRLARELGRDLRVAVMDFGEPYWFDAGNHEALHGALASVFCDDINGRTLREFLGLPDSIAHGESFVTQSSIHTSASIENSVVIGARILGPNSSLKQALVLGGSYGDLVVEPGGKAIFSQADRLVVHGPRGTAFRTAVSCEVDGTDVSSTLLTSDGPLHLSYSYSLGTIHRDTFQRPVLNNAASYESASHIMSLVDPLELQVRWDSLMDADPHPGAPGHLCSGTVA